MLQIHSIYQNQMVLQRDRPIPLRGRANPDSEVEGESIFLHDVPSEAKWIRFAWTPCPTTHLYNLHGLPAAPFRVAVPKLQPDSHNFSSTSNRA
jgi:hypothetical protein